MGECSSGQKITLMATRQVFRGDRRPSAYRRAPNGAQRERSFKHPGEADFLVPANLTTVARGAKASRPPHPEVENSGHHEPTARFAPKTINRGLRAGALTRWESQRTRPDRRQLSRTTALDKQHSAVNFTARENRAALGFSDFKRSGIYQDPDAQLNEIPNIESERAWRPQRFPNRPCIHHRARRGLPYSTEHLRKNGWKSGYRRPSIPTPLHTKTIEERIIERLVITTREGFPR